MTGMGKWASPEDLVGTVLERRYEVVALLGMGGMGAVYEGRHVRLDKQVAIKVLSPALAADDIQRRRFLREARAANRIAHDNVVEILDFGEEPITYFVMEYLQGIDLHKLIAQTGALPWSRARPIFLQILSALEAAHREGIVHRDVKPSNCFLPARRDGREFVKVLDFGIAKVAESSPETRGLTRTHEVMGTVSYMSPEQALAHGVDERTDIYAAGVVLFEMLTGSVPFDGTNSYQVLDKHVRAQPPAPRSINPGVPEAAELAILKALAKDPAARFQSMTEFIAAIELIDPSGFSTATQMFSPPNVEDHAPSPPTQLLDQQPAPLTGGPPPTEYVQPPAAPPASVVQKSPSAFVQSSVAPPETSPSRHAVTDPTVMFSDERRRSPAVMIAAVAAGLVLALGGAVALGWYLTGDSTTEPAVERVAEADPKPTDEVEAEPADAPEEPPALVIADPEPAEPEPAEPDAEPEPEAEVAPADPVPPPANEDQPANTKGRRRADGTSRTKSKGGATPAAETVASVLSRIKKKAASRCRTGVIGGSVVVTFLIRPDGGTSLVKPTEPNHRSAAGTCVADLVKAAAFPPGNDGRRKLEVTF